MVSHKVWSLITNHLRCRNQTNEVKYVLHHVDFQFQASTNELKPKSAVLIHNFFVKKGKANQCLISTPDFG